jgi:hypothetical protein
VNHHFEQAPKIMLDLGNISPNEEEDWEAIPTEKGFLYFHLRGTETHQWKFPKIEDRILMKKVHVFMQSWYKMRDAKSAVMIWKN